MNQLFIVLLLCIPLSLIAHTASSISIAPTPTMSTQTSNSNGNILITGGAGYIGNKLIDFIVYY